VAAYPAHPGESLRRLRVRTAAVHPPWGHRRGKIYDLTGPEALTATQQVAAVSAVTGKRFEYVNLEDDAALRGMMEGGMPRVAAEAMLHLVQALRGAPPPPTGVVAQLLARPARTVRSWVEENAAAFN
jgi:uncharacterized protein YbjT (DUF2867 family)